MTFVTRLAPAKGLLAKSNTVVLRRQRDSPEFLPQSHSFHRVMTTIREKTKSSRLNVEKINFSWQLLESSLKIEPVNTV